MKKQFFPTLSQLTICVIILSLLRNYFFYSNFQLPIKFFVGISELGLLIFDDLLVPILIVVFSLAANWMDENFEDATNKSEIPKHYKILSAVIIIMLGVVGLIMGLNSNTYLDKITWFTLTIGCISVGSYIGFLTNKIQSKIVVPIIFFFIMFSLSLAADIESVQNGKSLGTKIYTKSDTLTSTSSFYYIGQTMDYVFMYDTLKKSNLIIPKNEITRMELYSNTLHKKRKHKSPKNRADTAQTKNRE